MPQIFMSILCCTRPYLEVLSNWYKKSFAIWKLILWTPFSATLHYHKRILASARKQRTKKSPKIDPLCPGGLYLPIIASTAILDILFRNYFRGAKIWWLVVQLYKNSTDCFVLEALTVGTVSRLQNRKCIIESQVKENKNFIY